MNLQTSLATPISRYISLCGYILICNDIYGYALGIHAYIHTHTYTHTAIIGAIISNGNSRGVCVIIINRDKLSNGLMAY